MNIATDLATRERDYKYFLRENYFSARNISLVTLELKWEGSWWDTITGSKQEIATVWTNILPEDLAFFQTDINNFLAQVHHGNLYPVRLKHRFDTDGMPSEIEME